MKRLAIFGGASNSGKSTLIDNLSKRYGLSQSKKFDLIRAEAERHKIPLSEIFGNFLFLEGEAMKSLSSKEYAQCFLLDSHYAIQPKIDNDLAIGRMPSDKIEDPYVLSFGKEAMDEIAKRFEIDLFYAYAEPDQILERRLHNMRSYYTLQRSLERENILNEMINEHSKFIELHDSLKGRGAEVRGHEIENKNGFLEERLLEIANILSLKK